MTAFRSAPAPKPEPPELADLIRERDAAETRAARAERERDERGRQARHFEDKWQAAETRAAALERTHEPYFLIAQKADQRARAAETRAAELAELDQRRVDAICHYRNLAISLGAKPEAMLTQYDRDLAANHKADDVGGFDPSEIPEVWDDLERAEARAERLTARNERAVAILDRHPDGDEPLSLVAIARAVLVGDTE